MTKKKENFEEKQKRIDIVNELIKEISTKGRKFFLDKHGVAYIFLKNNRLYMFNEYSGKEMCLNTKYGYQPKGWVHGGTFWGLTKDFIEFVNTGIKSNGNNGYGGLMCPHWGYAKEEMIEIQNKAKQLGYL